MKTLPKLITLCCLVSLGALFAGAFTGCTTTAKHNAYVAAGGTQVTVEAAISAYNIYAKQGKTTVAQNLAVKAAYEKYQTAMALVCDLGAIQSASSSTNSAAAFQQATLNAAQTITDILNLIQSFGVKL